MFRMLGLLALGAALLLGATYRPAEAFPDFKKAFDAKYVKGGSDALKAAFKTQSCNTCHIKGKPKKMQNAYGHELHEALEDLYTKGVKKNIKTDKEAILKALDTAFKTVGAKKSKTGETYDARIKAGDLKF